MATAFKLIADENIPLEVVQRLIEKGIGIKSVSLISPRIDDASVLQIAKKENRVLITFDKDFGDLIFRSRKQTRGVILLRIHPQSVEMILLLIYKLLTLSSASKIDLSISFCVVEEHRIRILPLSHFGEKT